MATSAPDDRRYAFAGASAALTSDAPRSHRDGSKKQHFGFAGCAVNCDRSHRLDPNDALISATGAAIQEGLHDQALDCALGMAQAAVGADKQHGPGLTDTEIKIGQTSAYSGPA